MLKTPFWLHRLSTIVRAELRFTHSSFLFFWRLSSCVCLRVKPVVDFSTQECCHSKNRPYTVPQALKCIMLFLPECVLLRLNILLFKQKSFLLFPHVLIKAMKEETKSARQLAGGPVCNSANYEIIFIKKHDISKGHLFLINYW